MGTPTMLDGVGADEDDKGKQIIRNTHPIAGIVDPDNVRLRIAVDVTDERHNSIGVGLHGDGPLSKYWSI